MSEGSSRSAFSQITKKINSDVVIIPFLTKGTIEDCSNAIALTEENTP